MFSADVAYTMAVNSKEFNMAEIEKVFRHIELAAKNGFFAYKYMPCKELKNSYSFFLNLIEILREQGYKLDIPWTIDEDNEYSFTIRWDKINE